MACPVLTAARMRRTVTCAMVLLGWTVVACGDSTCAEGGCPWVSLSEVAITPAASSACLTVRASQGSGGCVNPALEIVNSCSEAFFLEDPCLAPDAAAGEKVAPGARASVVVPVSCGKDEGDKFGFALKSHLGSEGTSLAFTAAKPKGC